MTRFQRCFVSACLAFLGGLPSLACASSGSSAGEHGGDVLVTLHDFKSGERFELASESHTDRIAYYSDARGDAVRKVQSDEIMSAFVDELERQGLDDHASAGSAPSLASNAVISWGLEVERGAEREHWLVGKGSDPAAWQDFQKCRDTFLQLYNITVSFQAVVNDSGKGFFNEQPRAAAGGKQP